MAFLRSAQDRHIGHRNGVGQLDGALVWKDRTKAAKWNVVERLRKGGVAHAGTG